MQTYLFNLTSNKSDLLTEAELSQWLAAADKIYEQDQHGVKVAKLNNGDFIKIFRVKNFFSITHFFSYARSFSRNAERLSRLGIPTIKVKHLYHIQNTNKSAVVYEPLRGQTISDALYAKNISIETATNLGAFIANLHHKGIYFRSLHLGNIVLTADNQLGLIDIADMTIFPWPLDTRRRLRNFSRLWRNFEDKFLFGYESICALVEGYHSKCKKSNINLQDIKKRIM